ncbi:dienelactone hydrolase family protein, partial [Nocardia abscessus]|uniref:dienelactone hydrolase family protein n=1 Tax=Nocardia abscessus TaxID=120957 RepID=UPI003CC80604
MPSAPRSPTRTEEVIVPAERTRLAGVLAVPPDRTALIAFAHGSGSGRRSPRNRFVAEVLNRAGFATMLVDLLTVEEEGDRAHVFDIPLLARRLVEVTHWLRTRPELGGLPTGYFGASTGAGAALWAATEPGNEIAAVVSRGGGVFLCGPPPPRPFRVPGSRGGAAATRSATARATFSGSASNPNGARV